MWLVKLTSSIISTVSLEFITELDSSVISDHWTVFAFGYLSHYAIIMMFSKEFHILFFKREEERNIGWLPPIAPSPPLGIKPAMQPGIRLATFGKWEMLNQLSHLAQAFYFLIYEFKQTQYPWNRLSVLSLVIALLVKELLFTGGSEIIFRGSQRS